MSAIPLELPMRAGEAAALADLVLTGVSGNRPLTDDQRQRLASRAAGLGFESLQPYLLSLARDSVHSSAFFVAVDGVRGDAVLPFLLRLAPAASPATSLFRNPLLIGRMRTASGREVVVNALPFASTDYETIRLFSDQVDRGFLPRPQGNLPAIAAGNRCPEISLPAAFEAYRIIFRNTGRNYASTVQLAATGEATTAEALAGRSGEDPEAPGFSGTSIEHLFHAGLRAAIRAGWREGYTAEADLIRVDDEDAGSIERARQAIFAARDYTKFTTGTAGLVELRADPRHPEAWSDTEVESRFEELFPGEERAWALDEFTSRPFETTAGEFRFEAPQTRRLAVKFGRSLKRNEDLYDLIRTAKSGGTGWKQFDFAPSLNDGAAPTTPEELLFYMHWLKSRGRPAQLAAPSLGFQTRQPYPETQTALERWLAGRPLWGEVRERVARKFRGHPIEELGDRATKLAQVAQHFHATLSVHSGSGKQAGVVEALARATGGRINYKVSGELQLQLLDVVSEQEAGSPWRALYDRMVARAEEFAAAGRFGAGNRSLAAGQRAAGRGSYLGDAHVGRADGNLFLVFCLGNLAGTRDLHSPDGDTRLFADKLAELPGALAKEARSRNTKYLVWLAEHLR